MSHDLSERRESWLTISLFAAIAAFVVLDMVLDVVNGETPGHLFVETTKLIMAFAGFMVGWWRIRRLSEALTAARQDALRWQEENRTLVQGLGTAIARQFVDWGLSEAEAEIGLLLLKGLSLKEIADHRTTSERTVREQARSVYRKSGLAGRNELAAYFLEDLLPGMTEGAAT